MHRGRTERLALASRFSFPRQGCGGASGFFSADGHGREGLFRQVGGAPREAFWAHAMRQP